MPTPLQLQIRPIHPTDSPALSRICLLTAHAGHSAEALHTLPELPGLVYALPYASASPRLPHTGGFVLVGPGGGGGVGVGEEQGEGEGRETEDAESERDREGEGERERILGYVLFASDTRSFEDAAEREWYPPLREKYPLSLSVSGEEGALPPLHSKTKLQLKEADKQYIKLLHKPDKVSQSCLAFSPAHLHINILPPAQRQGWGRRLLAHAVAHLRSLRSEAGVGGVYLGMDPRNLAAGAFYRRLGFRSIDGAPENYLGLRFEDWDREGNWKGSDAESESGS